MGDVGSDLRSVANTSRNANSRAGADTRTPIRKNREHSNAIVRTRGTSTRFSSTGRLYRPGQQATLRKFAVATTPRSAQPPYTLSCNCGPWSFVPKDTKRNGLARFLASKKCAKTVVNFNGLLDGAG